MRGNCLLEGAPRDTWGRAATKGEFVPRGPPGECDRVLTSPRAIQYLMPQAGHHEQVSPRRV